MRQKHSKESIGALNTFAMFFHLVLAQVSCAMCVESVGLRSAGRSKEKPCRGEGTVAQRSGVFHGLSARRWRPRTAREAGRWRHRIDAPRHVGPGGTPANEAQTARAARDCPAANDWLGVEGGWCAGGDHDRSLAMPGKLTRSVRQAQKAADGSSWGCPSSWFGV